MHFLIKMKWIWRFPAITITHLIWYKLKKIPCNILCENKNFYLHCLPFFSLVHVPHCKASFTLKYLMCSGASSGTKAILALNGFFCKLSYALRGDYVQTAFWKQPLTMHTPKWHLRTICEPVGQNRGKTVPTIYQHDNQVPVPGTFRSWISSCLCSLNFKEPGSGPHSLTKTHLIPKMLCSTVK